MSRTTLITRSAVALFAGAVLSIAVGTGSVRAAENSQSTTQGGPADATRVLVYYIYQNAFSFFRMGYATAMSMVLFVILVVFTLLQMRLLRANESDLE